MRMQLEQDDTCEVMMAPLIDCVFLLLVFFLVTATLKKIHKELPIVLPQTGANVAKDGKALDDTLVVSVARNGDVYLRGSQVTTSALLDGLEDFAADPKAQRKRIRIDADKDTPFQHIVHVLVQCEFANLSDVGVRVRDPSEGN